MARRRFSKLKSVPLLQSAYTNFKLWEDRSAPTKYTRSATSNPGGYIRMAVVPFGGASTANYIIKVSKRANTELDTIIATHASDTLTGAIRIPGFEPAKAVVFRGTGGATEPESKITKKSYKKRTGVTYTHGFGAKSATEREFEAQTEITTAVMATSNSSVSFTPERFYQV